MISARIGSFMQNTEEIDDFDLRLLAALQADGRLGVQDLAERIGLSASQCSRRRARLEHSGLIRAYHADLDAERLGFGVLVFIQVTLARHAPDTARGFRELVGRLPEIQEAHAVTGDADYLLKVVLPDLGGLSHLIGDVLLAHGSIAHLRSCVVLERLKESRALPLHGILSGLAQR